MKLTPRDELRLKSVDQRLRDVVRLAADITEQPFMVIEGFRTHARQLELWNQGRNGNPGPIVTWTMDSKHLRGEAVDLGPLDAQGAIPWKDASAFDRVAQAMTRAATELNVSIRWGADWDKDGKPRERGETDSPHFELA